MLLELLLGAAFLCVAGSSSVNNNQKPKRKSPFEEEDSYFDRHGNEHIVDEDGYCDECNDYHDY